MSRIRLFRLLNLRYLRRQPLRLLFTTIAVAAGVTATVATLLLYTSIQHSTRQLLSALAGPAPLRVVGPLASGGLDEDVAQEVAAVDGVDAAVPTVRAEAVVEASDGRQFGIFAVGVDCSVEALVGAFGCEEQALRPARNGAPVLTSSTLSRELGEGAVVRTSAGRFLLDGVSVNDALDETNDGYVAIYDLDTAQSVFDRADRLDAVYVVPDHGVDARLLQERIRTVVGGWNQVLLRQELGPAEHISGPILPLLGLTIVIAIGFSGLLVYNIVSLSLAQRRRDLAIAVGVGTDPRWAQAGILAEAGLLGLLGGVVGALAGMGFGYRIVGQANRIFFGSGLRLDLDLSPVMLAVGVCLGVVTALIASYVPARRVRRVELVSEVHGRTARIEETVGRANRRLLVLLGVAAGAVVLSYVARRNGSIDRWQPPLGLVALLVGGIALVAAVGAAAPLVLRLLLRPLRGTGGPIRVAVANLVANPRRTSVVATAAGAAVGLACVIAALGPSVEGSVRATAGEAVDGRVWVSTLSANNAGSIDARPSPQVRRALAGLPGVAGVDEGPCTFVVDDAGLVAVCAHDGGRLTPHEIIAGEASQRALDGGEAILGPGAARSRGLRPGSTLRLPTPGGFADLRVAGIWTLLQANGYSVTVSPDRFEELFGPRLSTAVLLRPEPGVVPSEVVRGVEEAGLDPDLYALTPEEFSAQLAGEIAAQAAPFWTLQRILLFVALVAALATLLLLGVQRRRELGVLGALGFGPGGLARMTLAEAGAAALVGSLLGVLASLGVLEVFRNVAVAAVGHDMPFRFEAHSAVAAVILATVVVTAGGLFPAWRTSRLQIVEAIRDE